jgi:hypothetical protein
VGSRPLGQIGGGVADIDLTARDEDWVFDDPAGRDVDAVCMVRDEIDGRVQKLISELRA